MPFTASHRPHAPLFQAIEQFFHLLRRGGFFFLVASGRKVPSARAPVSGGLPQYCAFCSVLCSALLSFFFFVDTQLQHSSRPKRTSFLRLFIHHTHAQPQPWVSPISSPMLASPVSQKSLLCVATSTCANDDCIDSPEQLGFHPLLHHWVCPLPLCAATTTLSSSLNFDPAIASIAYKISHRLSHNQAMICMQQPSPSFIFFHPSVPA